MLLYFYFADKDRPDSRESKQRQGTTRPSFGSVFARVL